MRGSDLLISQVDLKKRHSIRRGLSFEPINGSRDRPNKGPRKGLNRGPGDGLAP